jgi:hypothetical membrane protein
MIESMFEKIKGAYFAFLALIATGFGLFGALFIYLPTNPSFSIFSNYISDLGAGPISARIVFSFGMIFGAIFLIFLVLYIGRYLKKIELNSQFYLLFGIIAQLGLIVIGLFPLDRLVSSSFLAHSIAAVIFFSFTAISNLFLGYLEFKNENFPKIHAIFSLLTGIFSGIFAIGFILQEFGPITPQSFIFITEWGFFGLTTLWLILHGIFFWKKD